MIHLNQPNVTLLYHDFGYTLSYHSNFTSFLSFFFQQDEMKWRISYYDIVFS